MAPRTTLGDFHSTVEFVKKAGEVKMHILAVNDLL